MPIHLTARVRAAHAIAIELNRLHEAKGEALRGADTRAMSEAHQSINVKQEELAALHDQADEYTCCFCESSYPLGDEVQILVVAFTRASNGFAVYYPRGEERVLVSCPGCDDSNGVTQHISSDD